MYEGSFPASERDMCSPGGGGGGVGCVEERKTDMRIQ